MYGTHLLEQMRHTCMQPCHTCMQPCHASEMHACMRTVSLATWATLFTWPERVLVQLEIAAFGSRRVCDTSYSVDELLREVAWGHMHRLKGTALYVGATDLVRAESIKKLGGGVVHS